MTDGTLTPRDNTLERPAPPAQDLGGAAFYSFAGTAWAAYGVQALRGWGRPYPALGVLLAVLGLLAALLVVRRQAGPPTPRNLSPDQQQREAREGRTFAWVNAGQGVAIFVMLQFCLSLHHSEYIAPLLALIVGIHFLVLAPTMQTPSLWATGGLMCLVVLITLLATPNVLWGAVASLGSGVILWASAAYRLRPAILR